MKKILIADNSRDVLDSMEKMLAPFFCIQTATTGYGVLKLLAKENYGGVILDVDFGSGINGLEIASIIRERNREIKIIIFSAVNYSSDILQRTRDMGATFCEKPVKLNFILKIMEE